MLELKHISKQFQERMILDDISIKLPSTGMIGIQGESGCGKSTLLYIIGMLDHDFEGEVFFEKEKVVDRNQFICDHVSYMMQNKDIIPSLTIKENIILSCQVSDKSYTSAHLKKITSQLGIYHLLSSYPSQLSGGQLKRVSIAKALLKGSSLVLCDEPTGALHSNQAQEVMELLFKLSQTSLVIIVSHDPLLLKKYCHYVLTLKNGKLNRKVIKEQGQSIVQQKRHHYSLWFYPLRQFLYQRNKLLFLFLFQWIVIVAFFIIVTAMNGVFEAIEQSEIHSVQINMMSIENKNGNTFESMFQDSLLHSVSYQYHLDQLQVFSQQKEVNGQLLFLPQQTSHILLKSGHLPTSNNEVIVSEELFQTLNNDILQLTYDTFSMNVQIVGVIQKSLFQTQNIYVSSLLKENIPFLQDRYTLSIESNATYHRQLYEKLSKNYFCYSEVLERIDNYQSLLKLAQAIAYVFIGVSFFISLLLIAIVESTIYTERKHDIAYLLSLGISKQRLLFLCLGEAMFIGGMIAMGGSLCSLLLEYYINHVYDLSQHFSMSLKRLPILFGEWDLYGFVFLSYLMMSILGIIYPVIQMMKTDMIEVLREE